MLKDYQKIFNILIMCLEDGNVLVYTEAMKCFVFLTKGKMEKYSAAPAFISSTPQTNSNADVTLVLRRAQVGTFAVDCQSLCHV